jgi:hypothetical protein
MEGKVAPGLATAVGVPGQKRELHRQRLIACARVENIATIRERFS